mgnify:FL=1
MISYKFTNRFAATVLTMAIPMVTSLAIAEVSAREAGRETGKESIGKEKYPEKVFPEEFIQAIKLEPNLENGKQLYKGCIACHGPEGWGTHSGSYPQIAGQLKSVIIKQLADFRAGNRDNPIMRAFTSQRALGGPQDIADVSGYIANLPMTTDVDKGIPLRDDNGEKLYKEMCANCHGENGEGDWEDHGPALYAQHFSYLKRQFDWIRNGRRRNADPKMTRQIKDMSIRDEVDILSYTAQLEPPKEKLAEPGWTNPDFPGINRRSLPK